MAWVLLAGAAVGALVLGSGRVPEGWRREAGWLVGTLVLVGIGAFDWAAWVGPAWEQGVLTGIAIVWFLMTWIVGKDFVETRLLGE